MLEETATKYIQGVCEGNIVRLVILLYASNIVVVYKMAIVYVLVEMVAL